jgi:hypothetical protein
MTGAPLSEGVRLGDQGWGAAHVVAQRHLRSMTRWT